MGQTLSHGVYLPAEGERNCYSGLASNWNLLDTAIGDTAGKASATHTHGNISNDGKVGTTANLPLITGTGGVVQAGSFGNQANTFCEGNDSRLSDARTPVAHTHGKADITDLFNSANTWSGYNTFTSYIALKENAAIPAGGYGKGIAFQNYQSNRLGYIQPHLTFGNEKRLLIGADSGNVAINSNLIPHANNSYNLGTSTNKWTTLNGVNPGALSLPDPSGVLTVEIPSSWVWDGTTENSYTAPITGWIGIGSSMATYVRLFNNNSKIGMTQSSAAGTDMRAYIPMVAGDEIKISGITSSSFVLRVYKCLGNV